MQRRDVVIGGGALAALAALGARGAAAADFATLKLFVPAAPGGGWDQTGRSIEKVAKETGLIGAAQFEHAPGAGGTVGLPKFAAKQGQGDWLMVGGMVMVGAILANKAPVDLTKTTPIARLTGEALAVVVPASSPHKTMAELAAAMKADPGKVAVAGGSAGGSDHILAALIAQAAGVDPKRLNYVAYAGGGPAQAAILGGHVAAGVSGYGEFAEQVKAGKMRALALSADKRLPGIDVPTLKEQGIDVELFNWRGVFAAPGISAADKAKLVGLMTKLAASPAWEAELKAKDWTGVFLAGDAFDAFVASETKRIGDILRSVGLVA